LIVLLSLKFVGARGGLAENQVVNVFMHATKVLEKRSPINRLLKYLTAATKPVFWPGLARGVMPTVEHMAAIRRYSPKTLIDVGANKGQFSLMARHLFPDIEIHAFEPLESERTIYERVVRPPTRLYPTALGRVRGDATFFVTSRADSSSLLRPAVAQEAAYGVQAKTTTTVPVMRLSDAVDLSILRRPILLKLDVQGGELDVLKGVESSLPLIDLVYCEASFVELYHGQPLASEIIAYLAAQKFNLRGVFNQSITSEFGPTQADFLFTLNSTR
jgi:FkbM family methyltransferase